MEDRVLIICGSRGLDERAALAWMHRDLKPSNVVLVISGGCRGADRAGEEWAAHFNIPCVVIEAEWALGRGAGPRRNKRMARLAAGFVHAECHAFYEGPEPTAGTANMLEQAKAHGLIVVRHLRVEARS